MKHLLVFLSLAAIGFTAPSATAGVIFSQTPVNGAQDFGSDFSPQGQQEADNFLLSGNASVAAVRWWGVIYAGTPSAAAFNVRFFADAAGSPAITPFSDQLIAVAAPTATAFTATAGRTVYEYSADLLSPVALLGSTTYYLSIVENVPVTQWGWAGDGAGSAWVRHAENIAWGGSSSPNNFAFQLLDTPIAPVPLPAAAYAGLGVLAGLATIRRLRRATGEK